MKLYSVSVVLSRAVNGIVTIRHSLDIDVASDKDAARDGAVKHALQDALDDGENGFMVQSVIVNDGYDADTLESFAKDIRGQA